MCLVLPCFTSPRSKQGGGLLSTTLLFPRACIDSACIGPLPTLGCLQRLMAVKLTSPNGRVLRLLQKKITTMLTIADNAHVFVGQKSTVFFAKNFTCMLGAPTTFSLMNSTRSLRPCCAAQCIGVKPFSYLT